MAGSRFKKNNNNSQYNSFPNEPVTDSGVYPLLQKLYSVILAVNLQIIAGITVYRYRAVRFEIGGTYNLIFDFSFQTNLFHHLILGFFCWVNLPTVFVRCEMLSAGKECQKNSKAYCVQCNIVRKRS